MLGTYWKDSYTGKVYKINQISNGYHHMVDINGLYYGSTTDPEDHFIQVDGWYNSTYEYDMRRYIAELDNVNMMLVDVYNTAIKDKTVPLVREIRIRQREILAILDQLIINEETKDGN